MCRKTIIWVFEHPNTSSFETGVHQLLCEQSKMTPIDFAKPIIWSFVGEPCLSLVLQRSIATLWNTHRPTKGTKEFSIHTFLKRQQPSGKVHASIFGMLKGPRCWKHKSKYRITVFWEHRETQVTTRYTAECDERRLEIYGSGKRLNGPRELVCSYPINCFRDVSTTLALFVQHLPVDLHGPFATRDTAMWQQGRGGYRCEYWTKGGALVRGFRRQQLGVPVDVTAGPMTASFAALALNADTMESGGSALAN